MTHEEIFNYNARKRMAEWNYAGFKKAFSTLHRVILASMAAVAAQKENEITALKSRILELEKPLPCSTVENMPPDGLNLGQYIGMVAELWDETQDIIKESCYQNHPYLISDRDYTEKGFAWGRTLEDGLNVKAILYKRQ